jgi:tetratricopeptide (TPR) repeat protein
MAMAREPVPTHARYHYSMFYLAAMGRSREAAEEAERGLDADPLNFLGNFQRIGCLFAARMVEEAVAELLQLTELHQAHYQPFYLLGLNYALQGKHAEALAAAEKAHSLAPWNLNSLGLLAGVLKRAGNVSRAEELRQRLNPEAFGAPLGLFLFYLVCSESDAAAGWAEKAVEQRDPRIVLILLLLRGPFLDIWRSSARWAALAKKMNLPEV